MSLKTIRIIALSLIIVFIYSHSYSQVVFESLATIEKRYAPLFGKEITSLSVSLIRQFELNRSDTSRHLLVKVNQSTVEQIGHSIGISIFSSSLGGGNALSGGASYIYNKESGFILMGYDEFMELYAAMNNVFTYITAKKGSQGEKKNSLVTYKSRDMVFGGEYNPSNLIKATYYIKVGTATFTIPEEDFTEFANKIREIRLLWQSALK